tara:strand:+ start:498 stop:719 length:222 start_codon:yes stop_codon:yes gene_type:complete
MVKPKNNYEALLMGLELAITAPTEKKSIEALQLAEAFATQLTKKQVERAKNTVLKKLNIKQQKKENKCKKTNQ